MDSMTVSSTLPAGSSTLGPGDLMQWRFYIMRDSRDCKGRKARQLNFMMTGIVCHEIMNAGTNLLTVEAGSEFRPGEGGFIYSANGGSETLPTPRKS
eukprot:761688-Hanusia_phi.AAC.1